MFGLSGASAHLFSLQGGGHIKVWRRWNKTWKCWAVF